MKSRDEYETKRLRLNEVLVGVNIKANAIFRAGIPFQISFGFSLMTDKWKVDSHPGCNDLSKFIPFVHDPIDAELITRWVSLWNEEEEEGRGEERRF